MNFKSTISGVAILFMLFGNTYAHQGGGTVDFQVTTVTFGGKYAQKNIGAIWVADSQNSFVKTLKVWASRRMRHLVKWNNDSGGNVVDAVTSATLRAHQSHNVTWDCTDVNGQVVADGTYKILVEFTEDNSSQAGRPQGKWTSIAFTKGATAENLTPADETYFKNMKLVYTPANGSQAASISGTVLDATNNTPVTNATVQLKQGNNVSYEISSDGAGLYSFNSIQAGSYVLVCLKTGYQTWTENISAGAGEQISGKNISLTPTADSTPPAPPRNVRVTPGN